MVWESSLAGDLLQLLEALAQHTGDAEYNNDNILGL